MIQIFNRKYKSGSGFAFWRWTDIVTDGDLYLRRLHIIQIPYLGAIMLHWIMRPDRERVLHDHPVSFLSIVIKGSYIERRGDESTLGWHLNYIRWFNFVRAEDAHVIWETKGVLTLVFAGPKRREWGFHTENGWVRWQDYK